MHEEIRRLAESAGREIMTIYRAASRPTVNTKADQSPVTQADLIANEILVTGLSKLTSELIISEESSGEKKSPSGREPFWLIDPLDGTRDFVGRLDTFVVCVARIVDDYPAFGLIHWPVSGETWWAEKSKGAFGPEGRKIFNRESREELICAGSRSMPSDRMKLIYEKFKIKEIQRYGSALKFCRLSEGAIDFYPRLGPTYEWDTAAGQAIAEEAGCKVIEISTGERLKYGKPGLENRGGFVASRADLDVVAKIRELGLQIKR